MSDVIGNTIPTPIMLYGRNPSGILQAVTTDGSGNLSITGAASSVAFSGITTGTNTAAAMTVGTGASLAAAGSGTIGATSVPFSGITTGTNTTAAMLVGAGGSFASIPEVNIGAVGTAGVLGLIGSTSGTALFTAPAVAGTTGNPVVSSNALSVPPGSLALPGLVFTGQTVGFVALHSGEIIVSDASGNGTSKC